MDPIINIMRNDRYMTELTWMIKLSPTVGLKWWARSDANVSAWKWHGMIAGKTMLFSAELVTDTEFTSSDEKNGSEGNFIDRLTSLPKVKGKRHMSAGVYRFYCPCKVFKKHTAFISAKCNLYLDMSNPSHKNVKWSVY